MTGAQESTKAFPARAREGILWVAALSLVWVLAVRVSWPEWKLNPQYQYALVVPFLCAVFFSLRWGDRPVPRPGNGFSAIVAGGVLGISTLLLGAVQPVFEANPDWRLLSALTLCAAAAWTMSVVFFAGGIPWVSHFAFPVAFLLVGIPWPRGAETEIMNVLMRGNSGIVVEVLHWCGYAARRQGNLILLPSGLLGVEEACSGIRSLQSGIVAALAYGELIRLRVGVRWVLIGVAIGTTLLGNMLRVILLSLLATGRGVEAMEGWHDSTGLVILVGTILAIGVVASLLGGSKAGTHATPDTGGLAALSRWSPALLASAVALAISWAATEAWYRAHEKPGESHLEWSLDRQSLAGKAKDVEVPAQTLDILRFPSGFSETWRDDGGLRWQAYYFRWDPGKVGAQVTRIHQPTVCLGATGMVLDQTYEPLVYQKGALRIRLDAYRFKENGRPLYVFYSISEDYSQLDDKPPSGGITIKGRFDAVLEGRRNRGQRMLELVAANAGSYEEAERSLRAALDRNILVGEAASP
ncbi:MAG: exosortase/archaeosortase family protein [Verrucomicrobiae bacterium]